MTHSHSHGHAHTHAPQTSSLRFAVATGLNIVFVVVELVFGVLAGSLALVADAIHNLGDVLGLVLAWGAQRLARREPTERRTFGWRKGTVLAALSNAMLVLVAVGGIAWEAVLRLDAPGAPTASTIIVVASVGVVINVGAALLLMAGSKDDLNVRGAFLHMLADAAVSVAVVVGGVVMTFADVPWLDPALSLAVSLVIVVTTWQLLRQSFDLAMDAVPAHLDVADIRDVLLADDDVLEVHDLHVWALSTTETALMAHLVIPADRCDCGPDVAKRLGERINDRFGIAHATLQAESPETASCCPQRAVEVV